MREEVALKINLPESRVQVIGIYYRFTNININTNADFNFTAYFFLQLYRN